MKLQTAQQVPFLNGGEMGERMRSMDWSSSPIGPPDTWPAGLRTALTLLLNSQFPMFIWWGPELTTFYNDAYIPVAGEKHPRLLGQSGQQAWAEVWGVVGPLVNKVMVQGEPSWAEDQLFHINRYGYIEESYFTFSHSPLFDDDGTIGGVFCVCTETTGKVIANRKARESEQNLRNTILQSPVAMCILRHTNFVVEIANDHMLELWGKPAEQMLQRPLLEGLPEIRTQGFEELLQGVCSTGKTFTGQEHPVELVRKGKPENLFVTFIYKPFREGDGSVSGVIVVAIDVTEQVLARKKVEASEQDLQRRVGERTADLEEQRILLDSILNASINGVLAMDAVRDSAGEVVDFRFVKMNQQAKPLIGIDESMIGKTYLGCFPKTADTPLFQLYQLALQTSKPIRQEVFSDNLNGWFDISIAKRSADGLVVTFANTSAQREAAIHLEEQKSLLDNILRHSPIGIIVYEAVRNAAGTVSDFKVVLSNHAADQFTGIRAEERRQRTVLQSTPALKDGPIYQMAVRSVEEGEPFRTVFFNEAQQKWMELSIVRMYEDHLLNVFQDITPIKEAQLQLENNIVDLQRSNADLEQFAYAASHDLKEPIRKLHFFTDRLKRELAGRLNEDEQKFFGRIENAAHRMRTLVEDLLNYSHTTKGAGDKDEVNLNSELQRVLEDLEVEVQSKDAIIELGKLPVLRGNPRQYQQLFQNLLSNALKYNRPGVSPEIRVASKTVKGKDALSSLPPEEGNRIFHLIEVQDNGIGFDQKNADKIFQVFTRLHVSATEYSGSGVGLSIVRKVVENHDGHVWADSCPGEGACFKILLPAT